MSLTVRPGREADARLAGVGAPVEDSVVLAHEDVAEDPQRAGGGRDVDAHEGEEADGAALERVLVLGERVLLAVEHERDVGCGGRAADEVLAHDELVRAHERGQLGHLVLGAGDERRARVHDGLVHVGELLALGLDGVQLDRPVGGAGHVHVLELALVVALVHAAERELAVLLVAQVEGEDRLVQQALLDHAVEGRLEVVDADGVEGQAEEAVELAQVVGRAEALGDVHLGEELVGHGEAAQRQRVLRQEARHGPAAVHDVEGRAVGLVAAGLVVVVHLVRAELLVGHPEVAGARVEDHGEGLRRRADGDGPVVLRVLEVADHDAGRALDGVGVAGGREGGRTVGLGRPHHRPVQRVHVVQQRGHELVVAALHHGHAQHGGVRAGGEGQRR
ncbi:hypothetical protein ON010_g8620 [Phytophthora cinnamomi]|nr:hypothetical protein ON010_g8620 [Phytophthora cinnamomi]